MRAKLLQPISTTVNIFENKENNILISNNTWLSDAKASFRLIACADDGRWAGKPRRMRILSWSVKNKEPNIHKLVENFASAGNRTRAARVAGEHSTTEPPMLAEKIVTFSTYEHPGHSIKCTYTLCITNSTLNESTHIQI